MNKDYNKNQINKIYEKNEDYKSTNFIITK